MRRIVHGIWDYICMHVHSINTVNIINVINELSKNNTLLLISHDESILSFVDRIITLDAGKIIDDKYIGSEY